jgi:hypothetical protein
VEEGFLNILGARRVAYYVEGSAMAKTTGK